MNAEAREVLGIAELEGGDEETGREVCHSITIIRLCDVGGRAHMGVGVYGLGDLSGGCVGTQSWGVGRCASECASGLPCRIMWRKS